MLLRESGKEDDGGGSDCDADDEGDDGGMMVMIRMVVVDLQRTQRVYCFPLFCKKCNLWEENLN